MTRSLLTALPFATAVGAAAVLAACGGGSGPATGTLRVALTDAPSCYDAVHVTVERVRVHRSRGAADADAGWSELRLEPARRINLVELTNGVLEHLGELPLEAGRYQQMRLVLADNSVAAPMANAVTPVGGAAVALATPSALQSGLKMNVDIDVPADKVVDVVLDFDACRSVVQRGQRDEYNLKPVVSVIPVLSAGGQRIVGHVAPPMAGAATAVSAQADGAVVKSTVPDANGRFVLYPVPAGQYDVVVTSSGRVNAVITGVPVTTTSFTFTNPETARIDPPLSALQRSAQGTLSVADATVRALQSFGGGPTVEVASVASGSGGYQLRLPVEPPVKAAYAAGATTLAFVPDAGAAAKYRLEARADGKPTQSANIDLGAANATVNFVFP